MMSSTTFVTLYSFVIKPCVNVVVMVTLEVLNAANNPGLIVAHSGDLGAALALFIQACDHSRRADDET